MKQNFILSLAAALAIGASAQAATIQIDGQVSATNVVGALNPFDVSFSQTYTVDDRALEFNDAFNGGLGAPLDFSSPLTVGATDFGTGNVGIQLFANSVVGVRININGIADNTTNFTQGVDDFRIVANTLGATNLLDILDTTTALSASSIAFSSVGSTFSQVNVEGEVRVLITDYTPIAAVPLPASVLLMGAALAGLGGAGWRRRKSAKAAG